jgi:hypothetical protein
VRSPRGGRLAGAYIYGRPVSDDDTHIRGGLRARTDLVEHEQQFLALLRRDACLQRVATVCKRIPRVEDFNHDVCLVKYGGEMW